MKYVIKPKRKGGMYLAGVDNLHVSKQHARGFMGFKFWVDGHPVKLCEAAFDYLPFLKGGEIRTIKKIVVHFEDAE